MVRFLTHNKKGLQQGRAIFGLGAVLKSFWTLRETPHMQSRLESYNFTTNIVAKYIKNYFADRTRSLSGPDLARGPTLGLEIRDCNVVILETH